MTEIPFTELGVAGTAVGTLYWVVKAFLKHLTKKDEVFTKVIQNHMHEDIEVKEKLITSHGHLTEVVGRLADKLEK